MVIFLIKIIIKNSKNKINLIENRKSWRDDTCHNIEGDICHNLRSQGLTFVIK